ncbi:hypothetical protein PtA15_12A108 [Puccinia triticina]|uniref:Uncharacterized protein n=1 Tax=Puccinia triticina TaxID=208348 RepID=A0ABY7CYZ1_9BASI|nr:uncharacterized protein PtA15_12A108 [Puccinia triticina]WAQ90123.1 hypothetical protein PtA15_12A108 [Puccinia triticina]WAR61409.1 hypothetical protein PtB15_12B94 [Puccinia triticina]
MAAKPNRDTEVDQDLLDLFMSSYKKGVLMSRSVTDQIHKETDLICKARNAKRMAELVASNPSL